jgi:hypothetical protein
MLRIDQEAAMWKITTRGFTLEEVLIMAAMNLLENAASTGLAIPGHAPGEAKLR